MCTRLYPRLQGVRDDCILGEAQHNKEGIGQFRSKNRVHTWDLGAGRRVQMGNHLGPERFLDRQGGALRRENSKERHFFANCVGW